MKKNVLVFLLITFNLFCPVCAYSLEISAHSAILFEPVTEKVLYEKNSNSKMSLASTTKIVTAITAIENGNLDDVVTTSKLAAEIEGSSIWLEEGEKQTFKNLLYGLMLSSGNDAAIAIAEHISGISENFAKLMNQTAKLSGAFNSNFTNPSGLFDENHYTTAYDLAKITSYAYKNKLFKEIVATKEYKIPWEGHEWGRTLKNHNKLLNIYEGCIGVKTGFTKKSGRCLVSSAERNGIQLIAVTLNAPDDWNDHIKMLNFGFESLNNVKVLSKDESEKEINIKKGVKKSIRCRIKEDVYIPLSDIDKVNIKFYIPEEINAPVNTNEVIGYVEVILNEKMIKKVDLYALEDCSKEYIPTFYDYLIKLYKCIFI